MIDSYDYPSTLFCPHCETDVDVDIVDEEETYESNGTELKAPYKAAICPFCKNIVCDRDKYYAVLRIAKMQND